MDKIGSRSTPQSPAAKPLTHAAQDDTCPIDTTDTAHLSGTQREQAMKEPRLPRPGYAPFITGDTKGPPEDHVIEATGASFDCIVKCSPTPIFVEFYNTG